MKAITAQGIFVRFIIAAILVFSTYNPESYSYYDWLVNNPTELDPLKILAGIILLIGWVIYLRATLRSLGAIGLILACAFFGTLVWLIIDWGIIPADSIRAVSYLILIVLCAIMATGISWSHIRRRISGQVDVDEIEDN